MSSARATAANTSSDVRASLQLCSLGGDDEGADAAIAGNQRERDRGFVRNTIGVGRRLAEILDEGGLLPGQSYADGALIRRANDPQHRLAGSGSGNADE